MFYLLFLRIFLKFKKPSLRAFRSPIWLQMGCPPGSDVLGKKFFSNKIDFSKERHFKTQLLIAISTSHRQVLLPLYTRLLFCFVWCLFFFLPFFLFSKSGIRMEAGGIPWELRTIAENTKKCSEGPSICQAHVIYSKECHTGYVSWWEDSKQTDKLRMLSTHRKRFGNGNNGSYSPKYFILHLK